MSVEQNKTMMRRYFDEAWNTGNLSVLDEMVAADYANHTPAVPGLPPGPEGLKPILAAFRAAFPDLRFSIEDMMAEADRVVTRWTLRGTHQGEFLGLPPTGKPVVATGIEIDRIVEGKIVEHWLRADDLGLMQQLGAIPGPVPG
jgi:steroid delta-isomerase-like uncharacterized protein